MTVLLLGIAAFCTTMIGGWTAVRLSDKLHLILGFSAGAVVAVAFFDLIPEALSLGTAYTSSTILSLTAVGFLFYLILDRVILLHNHAHEGTDAHEVESRGNVRAGSLAVHSLLDGIGIGLAFQVSPTVGGIVTAAVLAHDFSDGINTVSAVVRGGGTINRALKWLCIDAIAPLIGIILTLFVAVSASALALLLALFAGFFLYIGASDLIPESHHQHPKLMTTAMTALGMAVLYVAIQFSL